MYVNFIAHITPNPNQLLYHDFLCYTHTILQIPDVMGN